MKYASSIRFGGQLIDAKDCDYEDYKRLGLLCPECKDPVFLKAEGTRQQGGKEVRIGAHFSHFATKNPELTKVCENRIKSYTQADIDRAVAKAKGQRLKLLQRWFWSLCNKYYIQSMKKSCDAIQTGAFQAWLGDVRAVKVYGEWGAENELGFEGHWTATKSDNVYTKAARVIAPDFLMKTGPYSVFEVVDFLISAWKSGMKPMFYGSSTASVGISSPELCFFASTSKVEWSQQELIVKEVLAFMGSSRMLEITASLLACFMADFAENVYDDAEIKGIIRVGDGLEITSVGWVSLWKSAQINIVQLLCTIPWADEFARLSAESKVGAA